MHRPCLFATEVLSDKGKIKKVYKHAVVKTPLECLAELSKKRLVTFKKGITLKDLEGQACPVSYTHLTLPTSDLV